MRVALLKDPEIRQRIEQAGLGGQRELEHHLLAFGQGVELLEDFLEQDLVGLGAFGRLDVHFGFDNRHQTAGQHLLADFELLRDHGGNALAIGEVDDRAFLGAEHAQALGAGEQRVEFSFALDLTQLPRPFQLGLFNQSSWNISLQKTLDVPDQISNEAEPALPDSRSEDDA